MNTHKYGHGETRNRKLIKRRNNIRKDGSSAVFHIALEKGRGKKGKKIKLSLRRGFKFGRPFTY